MTRFIYEDSTHSITHGNLDGCDRQQPSSDTVSEVTSVATTVASPGDSKTMKCTLDDCDAAEACKKRIKGSAHYSEARAQTGTGDLSTNLNLSSLPSNYRQYRGVGKECLSSEAFKNQAISKELIEITVKYFEMILSYLDPPSSENSSEMKTALQLTAHLLLHRYKEFMIANEAVSAHVELEGFEKAKFTCRKCSDADEDHLYD